MVSGQRSVEGGVEAAALWASIRLPHVNACDRNSILNKAGQHPFFLFPRQSW